MQLSRVLLALSSCSQGVLLLFLLVVLPRWEPKAAVGAGARSCSNKLVCVLEIGVWVPLLDLVVVVAEDGERWSHLNLHGELLLQVGDHHMTATVRRHDLWLRWQPLQTPSAASSQPPRWRPSVGFPTAHNSLPLPSGFVPGEKKDGRRRSPGCCGGEEGLDCFSVLLFRVLCANSQDCSVTFSSFGVLFVCCTPPTMNERQR